MEKIKKFEDFVECANERYFVDNDNQSLLLEMATIGRINDGNAIYKIAIHGPASNDRPMPHIMIS